MNTILKTVAAILASQLLLSSAQAQEFPSRPIRIVVPNSPGVIADIVPRVLGPEMAKVLGQPIIIENRPGANYALGLEIVAKQAPADGYTISSVNVETLASLPVTLKELRFDPGSDLPPFAGLVESKFLFGSNPRYPWKSFQEMVANAKANPGKLNTGVPSLQDATYLFLLAVRQKFGLTFVDVPYKGAAAAYSQAIMVNEVQLALAGEASAAAGLAAKSVRAIAVSGGRRAKSFPDVPTLEELGVAGADSVLVMLSAPSGTPVPILDKLNAAAVRALQLPEVKERIAKSAGYEVVTSTREEFAKVLSGRLQRYAEIARTAGIKPE